MGRSLTRGVLPERSPGSGSSSSISPGGGLAALTAAGPPRRPGLPARSTTRGQADRQESGTSTGPWSRSSHGRPTTRKPRCPARSAASWSVPAIPKPHRSKLFSALVTSDDNLQPGKSSMVTVVVLGGDADDYLAPPHFALLRGCDVARGTVTSRIFV